MNQTHQCCTIKQRTITACVCRDIIDRYNYIMKNQKGIPDFEFIPPYPGKSIVKFFPVMVKYVIKCDYETFENIYPEFADLAGQDRHEFFINKIDEWSKAINSDDKCLIVIPPTFDVFELNVKHGELIKMVP